MHLSRSGHMNSAAMLPPKIIPPTSVGLYASNNNSSGDNNTVTINNNKCKSVRGVPIDTGGKPEGQSLKYDDVDTPGNLSEDSMMMLSQSVDSINTLSTNGGVDETDHQVRTIFVSGLPLDAKPRELYLLFCGFKGYLSSTLKPAGKNGKPTAPVGFVTFKSREQAEEVMLKLQGIKFDPEGVQCMRLEFARTNTKVTKQKFPYNNTNINSSNTVGYMSTNSPPIPGTMSMGLTAGGVANTSTGHPAFVAPGFMANFQPSILSQLAAAAASTGTAGAYDTSPTALYAAHMDPTLVAAAASLQWNPSAGQHPTVYDHAATAAYLNSASGLLQANQLRAMIPGGLNAANFTPSVTACPSLQMVQNAIAQASAVAALSAVGGTASTANTTTTMATVTSPSSYINSTGGYASTGSSGAGVGGTRSPSMQLGGRAGNPAAAGRTGSPTQHQLVAPSPSHQAFTAVHMGQTASPTTLSVHQQQQQQSIAAAYHQTAVSLGLNVTPHTQQQHQSYPHHHQQQQQWAAAFGLLGGYSTLVKELNGNEGHVISQQTMASSMPGGYVNF